MDAKTRAKLKRVEGDAYIAKDWVRHDMATLALESRADVLGAVVERAEPEVIALLRKWAAQWCLDNEAE